MGSEGHENYSDHLDTLWYHFKANVVVPQVMKLLLGIIGYES